MKSEWFIWRSRVRYVGLCVRVLLVGKSHFSGNTEKGISFSWSKLSGTFPSCNLKCYLSLKQESEISKLGSLHRHVWRTERILMWHLMRSKNSFKRMDGIYLSWYTQKLDFYDFFFYITSLSVQRDFRGNLTEAHASNQRPYDLVFHHCQVLPSHSKISNQMWTKLFSNSTITVRTLTYHPCPLALLCFTLSMCKISLKLCIHEANIISTRIKTSTSLEGENIDAYILLYRL